jgi:hypothetical protein
MAATFTESIKITPIGFAAAEELLAKGDSRVRTLVKNVLTDTIKYMEKEIPRQIMARYDITPGSLNDNSHRAKFKMFAVYPTREDLNKGVIRIYSNRFPVMRFNVIPQEVPDQKGIPVSQRQIVSVITVRGSAQVGKPNRFLAQMRSGHIGVFMRKPDATHRIRPDGQNTELNISEEHMISASEMVASRKMRPILDKLERARMEQRWNYYTQRANWLKDLI